MSPYVVFHVFPYGALEFKDPKRGAKCKENGKRFRCLKSPSTKDMECLILREPVSDE